MKTHADACPPRRAANAPLPERAPNAPQIFPNAPASFRAGLKAHSRFAAATPPPPPVRARFASEAKTCHAPKCIRRIPGAKTRPRKTCPRQAKNNFFSRKNFKRPPAISLPPATPEPAALRHERSANPLRDIPCRSVCRPQKSLANRREKWKPP